MICPKCQSREKQRKAGFNRSGSQKYRCGACYAVYTPEPKRNVYPAETRMLAICMYVERNSYGSIAGILQVNPQSVANWLSHYTAKLPPAPMPNQPRKAELYTFIGKKKTKSMS